MTSTSDWTFSASSRQVLVRFTGDIDLDSSPHLRRALERAITGTDGSVLLDLSGVTFMDCSGLGVLTAARARLGDRLWLCGVPPEVTQLLRVTGLLREFGVADGAPAARRRVAAAVAVPALHAGSPAPGSHESQGPSAARPTDPPTRTGELEQRAAEGQARAAGRTRIDQARGLLMATYGCDAEEAWQMLFRASRTQGLEVHVLTEALIEAAGGRTADQTSIEMMAALDAVMTAEPLRRAPSRRAPSRRAGADRGGAAASTG